MCSRVVGIIGGMGPEATVDLMSKIIQATPAQKDQDHIRMLVDNNAKIPPRVEAILQGQGDDPGAVMAEMGQTLERWGADFLAIPCSTAHYFFEDVVRAVNIPVLNIIGETVMVLKKEGIKNVMLLATAATLKSRLYETQLEEAGIRLIVPTDEYQEKVLQVIRDVKAGRYQEASAMCQELIAHGQERGTEAIVLGCTDLPVVFDRITESPITIYDPTNILARAIVREACRQ